MKEKKKRKKEDNKEIEETIKEIENSKDYSRRMYKAQQGAKRAGAKRKNYKQ